jgi:hypothetical protein
MLNSAVWLVGFRSVYNGRQSAKQPANPSTIGNPHNIYSAVNLVNSHYVIRELKSNIQITLSVKRILVW